MFIISLNYKKDISVVESYLSEHRKFLAKYFENGLFIVSGRKNPRNGGIIIALGDKKDEIKEIIKEDPFYKNEVAEYEIIEFTPTMTSPEIEAYRDNLNKYYDS